MKVKILRSAYIDTKAIGLDGAPYVGKVGAVLEFSSKAAFDKWAAKAAPSSYEVIEDKPAAPAKKASAKGKE